LDGTPLHTSLEAFFEKLQALLPEPAHVLLAKLQETMAAGHIPGKDYARAQPLIESVTRARLEGRTLEVTYHSFSRDEVTTRKIDPYHLWYHQGGLYVIAYDHLRREVRIFALERIKALRETAETFALPSRFDVGAYMRESFGILRGDPAVPVKVKFSNTWARWIEERVWHPSQRLERLPGGELGLTLQVAVTDELKRWILSFGREAEVVEPVVLREAVRAEAQALLERLEIEDLTHELSLLQLTLPVMVGM
jgi:predicted DNA-binding transcriptional regulator YafY